MAKKHETKLDIIFGAKDRMSKTLGGINKKLAGTIKMASRAAAGIAIAGIAATGAGLAFGVKLAADLEQTEIALTTMLGSVDRAKDLLKELTDFAASTPFQIPGITSSAKSLLAFGVAQEKIIPSLTKIGDIAAGIGAPLGEIAELYGKAKVQGRLFGQDINQLTGRGIPIIGELAKQFGVAESEVKKLVASGQVNFGNLEQAFTDLTSSGGKFAGLMKAQSKSLKGVWSTLKDNVGLSLAGISRSLIDTFNVKGLIVGLGDFIQTLNDKFIAPASASIASFVESNKVIFAQLWETLKAGWSALGEVFQGVFDMIGALFQPVIDKAGGMANFMVDVQELIVTAMASMSFGFQNWQKIVELASLKASLSFIKFGNTTAHVFKSIPQVVRVAMRALEQYFFNLFTGVMSGNLLDDYFKFWKTTFKNIVTIVKNWGNFMVDYHKALWQSIKTGSIQPLKDIFSNNILDTLTKGTEDVTGIAVKQFGKLTDGVGDELKKLGGILSREKTGLEKTLELEIAGLSGDLSEGFKGFVADKLNKLKLAREAVSKAEKKKPDAGLNDPGAESRKKGVKSLSGKLADLVSGFTASGLTESAKQESVAAKIAQKAAKQRSDQHAEQKKTNEHLGTLVDIMNGGIFATTSRI